MMWACLALGAPALFAQTTLNGAGATFPYPIYSKWFSEYHKQHPEIEINYQSIGSGGGIRQVLAGTVDFGATDGPMTDKKLEKAKGILHIPMTMGAVVPIYNLPGIGQYEAQAIGNLDVPPILVGSMFTAFFVVLFGAFSDVLYALLDPRIRLQ